MSNEAKSRPIVMQVEIEQYTTTENMELVS